jgi:CheY-like chemotaxis protein
MIDDKILVLLVEDELDTAASIKKALHEAAALAGVHLSILEVNSVYTAEREAETVRREGQSFDVAICDLWLTGDHHLDHIRLDSNPGRPEVTEGARLARDFARDRVAKAIVFVSGTSKLSKHPELEQALREMVKPVPVYVREKGEHDADDIVNWIKKTVVENREG